MPSLELVCKRLFLDSTWFVKCVVGALLLIVPGPHFFAFGYLYALVEQGRRGERLELPAWEDWGRLFANGVPAFVIFAVLGLGPCVLAWLITQPVQLLPLDFGLFVYLPLAPALVLAGPLTVAGLYQYQKRGEYRDAFRLPVLFAMLHSSRGYLVVPTLAVIGFFVVGLPLMTFTAFVGMAAIGAFYAAFFRSVEESRKSRTRG